MSLKISLVTRFFLKIVAPTPSFASLLNRCSGFSKSAIVENGIISVIWFYLIVLKSQTFKHDARTRSVCPVLFSSVLLSRMTSEAGYHSHHFFSVSHNSTHDTSSPSTRSMTLDSRPWTLHPELNPPLAHLLDLDLELWTLDSRPWTLDSRP